MARQDLNEALAQTSFLFGGNAAYIEGLYAQYAKDPNSVDAEWQAFFGALKDDDRIVTKNAEGASWTRPNWPIAANGELVAALDGNWASIEAAVGGKVKAKAQAKGVEVSQAEILQTTRDSVRALMLIRAYRVRGHLHANLDPLELAPRGDHEELHPSHYGFTDADLDRPIFLDNVLGLEFGTVREIVAILERTYCQTLGVEFMHIADPGEKAWIQEQIEGPDKEIAFTREGKRAILQKLIEAEGFEKFLDLRYTGTKRFGLDGSEAMIPALEQTIKRGGAGPPRLRHRPCARPRAARGRPDLVFTQAQGAGSRGSCLAASITSLVSRSRARSFSPSEVQAELRFREGGAGLEILALAEISFCPKVDRARSKAVFCRSRLTQAVKIRLLASATSRLSRTATTSPLLTGSPSAFAAPPRHRRLSQARGRCDHLRGRSCRGP